MKPQLVVVIFLVTVLVEYSLVVVVCPPVVPSENIKKNDQQPHHESMNETLENDPILSLEYHKYLREIVNILETDKNFKQIIENASADDIKTGKIASNLDIVGHNIRTKLDELKRQEIDRLRKLISRKVALSNIKPEDVQGLLPKHIDHNNIETFEINDLEMLIKQATTDLEEVDRLRRDEFKEHELQKEYERRRRLEKLDPEARKREQAQHEKLAEERKHHERVNHPGSKDQLEEVWKKEDHLEGTDFNPKTFFKLHDIDGNDFLDETEIEAMFQIELDKIFNRNDPEYDPAERFEEASRMREHVFTEIDKNKDRMVSLEEFIDATRNKEFERNEEWKSLEDNTQFNPEEFERFSSHQMEIDPTTPHPLTTPSNNGHADQNQNNNNNQVPSNEHQQQQQHQQTQQQQRDHH